MYRGKLRYIFFSVISHMLKRKLSYKNSGAFIGHRGYVWFRGHSACHYYYSQ